MADTTYEYPDSKPIRGNISFTRFWKHGEDWVQITLITEDLTQEEVHTFASLPFSKFQDAFLATKKNVEGTTVAWWHGLSKGGPKQKGEE